MPAFSRFRDQVVDAFNVEAGVVADQCITTIFVVGTRLVFE